MKCQPLFLGENTKNDIILSSAEFSRRMLKVLKKKKKEVQMIF